MPLDIDAAFGIHAQALMTRSYRAQVLAANLVNADTPNYKARDIDFRATLNRARGQSRPEAVLLRVSHPAHIGNAQSGVSAGELLYRIPSQPSIDGNTVETQVEKAAFTRNALQYMTSLTFLNGRIAGLLTAIRGE